jgi:hypothetical protein
MAALPRRSTPALPVPPHAVKISDTKKELKAAHQLAQQA